MITALDASILVDVGLGEPSRAPAAMRAIEDCAVEGPLVICDVALAEVVPMLGDRTDPAAWLRDLGIRFDAIEEEAAIHAGRLHAEYLRRARSPKRFVADLLIGAHAQHQADRLLTRDRGFYRDYFRGLRVVEPR